jgi:hypothetical protein
MAAVDVQVITYAPTVFYHCQHCEVVFDRVGVGERVHREQALEALPQDLRDEFAELSDTLREIITRHGAHVRVRVIDAASIEGFIKSVRHGAFTYPAVIINGRRRKADVDTSLASIVEDEVAKQEVRQESSRIHTA